MADEEETPASIKSKNGGIRPVPDPTVLTTEQLMRTISMERSLNDALLDVLRERLHGMDEATKLRLATIDHIPASMDEKINSAVSVINEKFSSVAQQFLERDTKATVIEELKKTALDAAFAAQKESAAEKDKSNTLAITKSETTTTETINKNAELFRTENQALSDRLEDVKARVGVTEASMIGLVQNRAGNSEANAETRTAAAAQRQLVTIGISAFMLLIVIIGFVAAFQAKP